MAAVIRNKYDLQKYLHLIGNAGSGKGTFCKLVESLIGAHNTEGLRKQDLTDKEALSRAVTKPLVILDDLSPLNRSELDTFKSFTGEGKITVRQLYKNGFSTEFKGLSIVTSNHQIFNGLDTAITRRSCPVWFNQVPKTPRDLIREFKPEIPALIKYLIALPIDYIENTLRENYGKITVGL
jgi:putative DNA primase/helicase